ncbi:MAG: hypothetical protein IIW66_02950, partial [Bacteroidales bacterium]|nr:hypothetical protein [Bacteroidales bacterium]
MRKGKKTYWTQIKDFYKRFGVAAIFSFAIVFLLLSYIIPDGNNLESEVRTLESNIHKRQQILHNYVQKAFSIPINEWLELDDFP